MTPGDDLKTRAEAAGIACDYLDAWGQPHCVPEATLETVLAALGDLPPPTALRPFYVLAAGRRYTLPVPGLASWRMEDEAGEIRQGAMIVPPLAAGYYRVRGELASGLADSFFIVAPAGCWQPPAIESGKRVWGVAAQLYAVRSARNFGIGDYGDLARLAQGAAKLGADVLGLNPLHTMFPSCPAHVSPYSPSSRLFLNTLAIDVRQVDGFEADDTLQARIDAARDAERVDYEAVHAIKYECLEALFKRSAPDEGFNVFCANGGEALHAQAVFDALCEIYGMGWMRWPDEYRRADSVAVRQFAQTNADRVRYYQWLQYLADRQMGAAQALALQSGMAVGLYRDLAVGSDKGGAEMWQDPGRYLAGLSIGCPPDEYSPSGQNWGLPALNPVVLANLRFAPFIQLVRANMRHARALRIDHAFGLRRLFLIPDGAGVADGAYLHYPFEAMLAILKIESHRNQCIVIGEDLGTFPPGYKEMAAEAGLYSYKLLYFEREAEGGFRPPERYPARSLAALSTHDLPTFTGWCAGTDIDERAALGLYPSDALLARDRESRAQDRPRLESALKQAGVWDEKAVLEGQVAGVERFLAGGASSIVMVQLEDALGVRAQANLPATTKERPNWRMKLPVDLDALTGEGSRLAVLAPALMEARGKRLRDVPRATYRIQLHKDFTFDDAAAIVPYLADLGISHVYCSPYFQARPGSLHGYDITDHNRLNPELGGEAAFARFVTALKARGLKQLVDFVPNHMGVGSDNRWWLSVLEWGKESPNAEYFDIDWMPRYPGEVTRLIVPFLGDHYGDALAKGELELRFDLESGAFNVHYFKEYFPICPRDYAFISQQAGSAETVEEGEALKQCLIGNAAMEDAARAVNEDRERLHALLERQHYRLAFWRVAASDINYRRFFDVSELAGMRVEEPALFDAMHAYVLSLVRSGVIAGLRIDHIDGVADPASYCRRLREEAGAALYLTVEKILAAHEALPRNWEIDGTSGYDAMNVIANVFIDPAREAAFDRIYRRFTGVTQSYESIVWQARALILETTLASELQVLSLALKRIANRSRYHRDYPFETLKQALKDIIVCFPVYRAYVTDSEASDADIRFMDWAVARARKMTQLAEASVYDFMARLLAFEALSASAEERRFVRKFQQLTGPMMAKGMEDTSYYRYNRLLALNEVGGNPGRFGLSVAAFHQINAARAKDWPCAMLATATHDTKHGEDARMRLASLADRPQDWQHWLLRWTRLNRSRRGEVDGTIAPSRGEEYFIYQTLLGSWPVECMQWPPDESALEEFRARLSAYLTKALREAQEASSWRMPNEAYEAAVIRFATAVTEPSESNLFLQDFIQAARAIAEAGVIKSLGQLVLKLTLPGVPDLYQGTERWDLSLVDPDNRRAVDYAIRAAQIAQPPVALLSCWQDGRVKQAVMQRLLAHRADYPALYAEGDYQPLALADGWVGFVRTHATGTLAVIAALAQAGGLEVTLPGEGRWQCLLSGRAGAGSAARLTDQWPVYVFWQDIYA